MRIGAGSGFHCSVPPLGAADFGRRVISTWKRRTLRSLRTAGEAIFVVHEKIASLSLAMTLILSFKKQPFPHCTPPPNEGGGREGVAVNIVVCWGCMARRILF